MTVTFLEMTARPSALPPPFPRGKIAFLGSEHPPVHFYRYLYDTVGGKYFWVDRKKISDEKLAEIIQAPNNHLYILYTEGTPGGMAELELRGDGTANISYFGLTPEATGTAAGLFLPLSDLHERLGPTHFQASGQYLHPGSSPRPAALSARRLQALFPGGAVRGIALTQVCGQSRSRATPGRGMTPSDGKELTWRGVALGSGLTLIFTAANIYLGLKVGLTFATSIPAAVISMALLGFFPGSNIRENNIVQTVCSAAGALASIIFVLPGLVIVGWWTGFPFWTSFLICAGGGVLGVLFTIPLRRALVTNSDLPYPEGVAGAEVLQGGRRHRVPAIRKPRKACWR